MTISDHISQGSLKQGYRLLWYRIERVLGRGAFGVTYLARDTNLHRQVAIKEYFPGQYCLRDTDAGVDLLFEPDRPHFTWGMERFLNEARMLTQFEHPNIVRVLHIFEHGGKAYMVMQYESGISLSQRLKPRRTLAAADLVRLTAPLLDGLEKIHAAGFIHRDIKPANIYIRTDGSPVLLDFGSARHVRYEHTLTSLVSPGFAPIEQYTGRGEQQGPWTDIYGLGATLYRAVTGVIPPPAVDRSEAISNGREDPLLPVQLLAEDTFSDRILEAIDHALKFRVTERPRDIAGWREEFGFEAVTDLPAATAGSGDDSPAPVPGVVTDSATTIVVATGRPASAKHVRARVSGILPTLLSPRYRQVTAGALLAVALLLLLSPGGENTDVPTAPHPPAVTELSELPLLPAPDRETTATTAIDAAIAALLAAARSDLEAQRLTLPYGDNAYQKFGHVLRLDPDNAVARQGMDTIVDYYLYMARQATAEEDFQRAGTLLNRAASVNPDSADLLRTRVAMEQHRNTVDRQNLSRLTEPEQTRFDNLPVNRTFDSGRALRERLGAR